MAGCINSQNESTFYSLPMQQGPEDENENNTFNESHNIYQSKNYPVVDKIIKDAKRQFQKGRKQRQRHRTLFYKLVIGGAVDLVYETVETLKLEQKQMNYSNTDEAEKAGQDNEDVLQWLMCNDLSNECNNNVLNFLKQFPGSSKIYKYITLFILAFIWFILTPVIYIVHAVVSKLLNAKSINDILSISKYKSIASPLVFAVMSGEYRMLKIFLDNGISIDTRDRRGFSIIHSLADYSRFNSDKAMKCFEMLKTCCSENEEYYSLHDLHDLILDERNDSHVRHQNPIEYAVQFGSPAFATTLMHEVMTKSKLKISGNKVYYEGDENDVDVAGSEENNNESNIKHSNLNLKNFNVTNKPKIYLSPPSENGNNDEQDLNPEEQDSKTFWSYLTMDITKYSGRHLCFAYSSYLLHLILARPKTNQEQDSWWCGTNNPCVRKWIRLKFFEWQWVIYVTLVMELLVTIMLVLTMLQNGQGDMLLAPNQEMFTTAHVKIFLKNLHNSEDYEYLAEIFFQKYPDIIDSPDPIDYQELLKLIQKLPGFDDGSYDSLWDLYDDMCDSNEVYKPVGDFVKLDECSLAAANKVIPICEKIGFNFENKYMSSSEAKYWENNTRYEFIIATSFVKPIFKGDKLSRFKNPLRFEMSANAVYAILLILCIYLTSHIFMDLILRVLMLFHQLMTNVSVYTILSTPLPGSYIKRQCNIFTACGFIYLVIKLQKQVLEFFDTMADGETTLKSSILNYDRNSVSNISNHLSLAFITVMILVARVILHLHAMKLIPWVGKFVNTTFQMASDLFQFSLLYLFIGFAFSLLFHLFSRDETCPVYRDPNNFYFINSAFSTFALTFGHISINFSNVAVIVTYVTYTVISILLLLNLIIAVMSSTAANIVAEPWASQLYEENLLAEALGAESWYYNYCMPNVVRRIIRRFGGFIVLKSNEKNSEDFRVLVDVFGEFPELLKGDDNRGWNCYERERNNVLNVSSL